MLILYYRQLKLIAFFTRSVFIAGKQFLHSADQQGFTKTPGPGKEVVASVLYEPVDKPGLIYVDQVVCFEGCKVLDA